VALLPEYYGNVSTAWLLIEMVMSCLEALEEGGETEGYRKNRKEFD
jgi:hypothetical protein